MIKIKLYIIIIFLILLLYIFFYKYNKYNENFYYIKCNNLFKNNNYKNKFNYLPCVEKNFITIGIYQNIYINNINKYGLIITGWFKYINKNNKIINIIVWNSVLVAIQIGNIDNIIVKNKNDNNIYLIKKANILYNNINLNLNLQNLITPRNNNFTIIKNKLFESTNIYDIKIGLYEYENTYDNINKKNNKPILSAFKTNKLINNGNIINLLQKGSFSSILIKKLI